MVSYPIPVSHKILCWNISRSQTNTCWNMISKNNQGHAQWFKLTSSLIFDLKSNTNSSVQKQNNKKLVKTLHSAFFWYVSMCNTLDFRSTTEASLHEGGGAFELRETQRRRLQRGGYGVVCAGGRARKAQSGMRQTRAGKPVTNAQAHFGLIFKESQVYKFFFLSSCQCLVNQKFQDIAFHGIC